jgi:predicted permease
MAAVTLALGIGAVTAIFSVVNGVLLKPLPYPGGDRLVNVWSHAPKLGYNQFGLSPDIYFAYERDNQIFEKMALFQRRRANFTDQGTPEVVEAIVASFTYFDTLGVRVDPGRNYTEKEDAPDAERVVVISHRAWRDRFGRAADAVGRVIRLDGRPTEIIGVAPAAIDELNSPDFFMPTHLNRATPQAGNFGWNAIARLRPGVRAEDAGTHLEPIVQKLLKTINSQTYRAFLTDGQYAPRVHLVKEDLVGELKRPLWILLATVGMLLLIACANVANLFLVRAEGRQREIAVRMALGARRSQLVRQLMSEALMLAAIGSAAGIAAAAIGLPALVKAAPPSIPRLGQISLDWAVLAFAAGAAFVSAALFGLLPALRYTRTDALGAVHHSGRGGTDEPGRRRARNALVVLQTAMALVLLVGSGLLIRSFTKLMATDLGFSPTNVMTFRVALPTTDYRDDAAVIAFVNRLVHTLEEKPGVEAAGATSILPLAQNTPGTAHDFDGRPAAPGQLPPMVHYKVVGPGYFRTMQTRVRAGRDFNSGDFAATARSVIANQAIVDLYWPGQEPIGKRVRLAAAGATQTPPWFTVVGVVENERQDGLREPVRPLLYYAPTDATVSGLPRVFDYVVRGPGATARADQWRETVWSIDRGLPVANLRSMQEIVDRSIVEFTFTMLTLGIAAAIALLLGGIGLYGVLSYTVSLRTREIGVRLALGAPAARVMRSVVLNGTLIAGIGLVIGLAGSFALTRYLGTLLFDTPALDIPTFALMSVLLLFVAIVASFLPARRAAAVSPLEAMKTD